MNKTKLITLSLMTAATLAMVGCGSSSSTTTVTPPADTNDTNTTPVVVVPDYAKPAPISAISAQVLVNNALAIQASNTASALGTSITSALAAAITEAGANLIINNFTGDVPCAALTTGGSGSIHAEAYSLAAGGNGYTIDFNECKLDTGVTLATTAEIGSPLAHPACQNVIHDMEMLEASLLEGGYISEESIEGLRDGVTDCRAVLENGYAPDAAGIAQMTQDVVYITGLAEEFMEEHDEPKTLGTLAINNDILTIDNTVKADANWVPAAGNIWKTTFSAENFSVTQTDKTETTTKIAMAMNGNLAGDLSAAFTTDLNTRIDTMAFNVAGTNNLTSTTEIRVSTGAGLFIDFGTVGTAATYTAGFDMTRKSNTHPTFSGDWTDHIESNFNDSGDGHMVAYFDNLQNAYHGEMNLYNKAFVQERKLITDPLAIFGAGVARDSTYIVSGEFGMNTAGIPFIINTQGAFTFVTDTTASRTKLWDGTNTSNLAGGYIKALGTGGEITFEFSPNSDILMSVNGGLHTQLNPNTVIWLISDPVL